MPEISSNKTIAKNTLFLYFRMMFTMVVSLFTSRVVLQKLGVVDYGIYQAVGGVVGFLSFINGALATGSSRFLTFELGMGDFEKLKRVFSTTLTIHIAIAILVVLIGETCGLWFLYNKLVIPAERMDAAVWVFHLSILATVFSFTQVPYNASIISHEKMSAFAFMSIYEVSAKLAIVYIIAIGNFDRLKLYALLLFLMRVSVMLMYRFYCGKHFKETKYSLSFDKSLFKEIASFSGWSIFAQISTALNSQGILILLNMFFSPAVVTARAISIQVNMAISQFVSNFRTAVNPQVVKRLASGDSKGSSHLLLESTKYSYYMMFLLCFPVCILASSILNIWLTEVPEYTVIFLQLIVIQSLFQVFDSSFYIALYAMGRLRENALLSPTLGLIRFPIVYLLFKAGYSPVVLSWASLITYALLGLVIKPILIVKIAHYNWKEILSVYRSCLLVTILALPLPLIANRIIASDTIVGFLVMVVITVAITGAVIMLVGIEKTTRKRVFAFANTRVKNIIH